MNRIFGIRHRTKRTAEGEARPTQVHVLTPDGRSFSFELDSEDMELDFVKAISGHPIESALFQVGMIPEAGDKIAMILGGSGSSLAYALSRAGEEGGIEVLRLPAWELKVARMRNEKDDDAELLARLLWEHEEWFYETTVRDRAIIRVVELFRLRMEAMKSRMACDQRLRSGFIGRTFRSNDGLFPEGKLEDLYNEFRASDAIYAALEKEEKRWERELAKALEETDVYTEVFRKIGGIGPSIAAGIIAAVQDIRRFKDREKFVAFCGLHVLPDGQFARRRRGQKSNWSPSAKQAFFLLAQQCVYRKDSVGGELYRHYKKVLREKHPEVVVEGGKRRYTDGHIDKMARWRTVTRIARKIYAEWTALEQRVRPVTV